MKYLIFLILTFSLPSSYSETTSKETKKNEAGYRWETIDLQTKKALSYIANDDYVNFEKYMDSVEKSNTELPIANSIWAAMYYKITEEYRTKEFEADFDEVIKKAVTALEDEKLDKEKGDIYKAKRLQFLGSAYGYRGMYRTFKGLWASAFLDGKRAYGVLEDSLKLDPSLIDNKAGMGTYLYWRSAKSGVVKYLLFWGDKKEEGINYIKSTLDDSKIIKLWALGGLVRIYIEEKKGTPAIESADKILEDAPNDIGTLRRKAYVFEKQQKIEQAFNIYEKILPILKNNDGIKIRGKELNTANAQIECIYDMLRLNKELGGKAITEEAKKNLIADIKEKLSKRTTSSYLDIESLIKGIDKL